MKKTIFFLLSLLAIVNLSAQSIPDKPNPPRLVNDFAGMLDPTFVNQLESKLSNFDRETSTQVAVVTVPTLDGTDASDFAFKLGEKWGIGQKGKNNGILILIKPKTGSERGHVFIATGYGLEGAVPDAFANRIVDLEMIPRFKQGDYAGGIDAAVNVIMDLTRGEYTAEQYAKGRGRSGFIAIFIIIAIIIILAKIFGSGTRNMSSNGSSLPFWLLMGTMASGSRHSGSWGGFSSGSGGFGGFGGGGFGGGGAGGSW